MSAFCLLLILPALLLVATVLLPNRIANAKAVVLRRLVTMLAAAQLAVSTALATAKIVGFVPVIHWRFCDFASDAALALTVHYDNLACLMLMLVSFVGWVICAYSIRYLDGEATQGRYFRWTAFALGSVSLMVISGNLLMFMAAWVMTSTALHKLLLHYGHRPAAKTKGCAVLIPARKPTLRAARAHDFDTRQPEGMLRIHRWSPCGIAWQRPVLTRRGAVVHCPRRKAGRLAQHFP